MLPRTIDDIQVSSSIFLTSVLENTNFTQTQLDFSWTTNIAGSTEMYYGLSAETVTTNMVTGAGGSTDHELSVTGVLPGQVIWVQAFQLAEMIQPSQALRHLLPFPAQQVI